jgi:hypothetical protein
MKKLAIVLVLLGSASAASARVQFSPAFLPVTTVGRIRIANDLALGRQKYLEFVPIAGALALPSAAWAVQADAVERLSLFLDTVKQRDPALYDELTRTYALDVTPQP